MKLNENMYVDTLLLNIKLRSNDVYSTDMPFNIEEYKEYKRLLDILCSAVGYDHNFAFMRNIGRNGDILLEYQKIGQKRPMTPTLRLFHTSNNPNLKELAPKFKR